MSIRDRLQYTNSPAWPAYSDGEAGDELIGTIVLRSQYTSAYGPVDVLTVLPEVVTISGSEDFTVEVEGEKVPYTGGALAFHCMGTVAKNFIEDENPQVGDDVGIKYEGKKTVKEGSYKGKKYDSWTFLLDRALSNAAVNTPEAVSVSGGGYAPLAGDEEPF